MLFNMPKNPGVAIVQMEECISAVQSWMTEHFLKMNTEKTEFMFITSKRVQPPATELNVGNDQVSPTASVRNLGVIMHCHASLEKQIAGAHTISCTVYEKSKDTSMHLHSNV